MSKEEQDKQLTIEEMGTIEFYRGMLGGLYYNGHLGLVICKDGIIYKRTLESFYNTFEEFYENVGFEHFDNFSNNTPCDKGWEYYDIALRDNLIKKGFPIYISKNEFVRLYDLSYKCTLVNEYYQKKQQQ